MIPELGHVSLIIAFVLAIGLAAVPMWGALRRDIAAMNTAPSLAVGVTVFVGIAFALLAVSFLQDDF
jgi:cytochrome c-type biogenesis protein CcmF